MFMRNIGNEQQTLESKMNQGMKAHMPGVGTPTALPYLGADRVMPRGAGESDDAYAKRLQNAFPTWQHAGNRPSVMSQTLIYVGNMIIRPVAQTPICVSVGDSQGSTYSTWDTYYSTSDLTKAPAHITLSPSNWNWDGQYLWWRTWLVVFADAGSTIGPEGVWGDGTNWGDVNGSWGFNVPSSFFQGLRSIVNLWKSANTWYPWIIFCFNGGDGTAGNRYSPNSSPGAGNPDGTWGTWGTIVNGVYVASRPNDSRFTDGVI
jgi:hypothetical protein